MKKILMSLFMIALVSGAVWGTSAFFNDTEESKGNTFTTGAIDLTVDAHGWYNGLECVNGHWTNACRPVGLNLIKNGGFEDPEVNASAQWEIFTTGTSGLEWTVEWESTETTYGTANRPAAALQELHEGVNGWTAAEGNQYAELDTDWFGPSDPLNNEPALVRIFQNVTTEIGKKYELRYFYSPRPGVAEANNELKVRVNGTEVASHKADGGANTVWQNLTYIFTATTATTKVEFAGAGTADSLGVFLDNVSLRVMQCRSGFTEYEGKACGSTWGLTDLGPRYKFFDFADIKPGDHGENTVSLHVTSNNAYACMTIGNLTNTDLGLTEPEAETGDNLDKGELAENVMVFMWHDDGDNIWEENETPIINAAARATRVFNNVTYPLATPALGTFMTAGQTKYIGIAWCAGEMTAENYTITCDGKPMGNVAQTDQMTADISFYVEQVRNNADFTCTPEPRDDVRPN